MRAGSTDRLSRIFRRLPNLGQGADFLRLVVARTGSRRIRTAARTRVGWLRTRSELVASRASFGAFAGELTRATAISAHRPVAMASPAHISEVMLIPAFFCSNALPQIG